ncbi:MAG TPA: hypothetical protein VFB42_02345 [Gaiellaceae bacterium]|nr:hypothetical protein [Gaiellaceae bacterium]
MRGTGRALLAALAAAVGVAATLAAPAAAATAYQVAGLETAATASTGTFQGVILSQPGTWQATVVHGALDKSPGAVTPITGGSFALLPFGGTAAGGTVTGGQLVARAPAGALFCTQQFAVAGTLAGPAGPGSFQGILTHYGLRSQGACNATFATFAGSVTLP